MRGGRSHNRSPGAEAELPSSAEVPRATLLPGGGAPVSAAVNGRAAHDGLTSRYYKIGYKTSASVFIMLLKHYLSLAIWSQGPVDNLEHNWKAAISFWRKRKTYGITTFSCKCSKAACFSCGPRQAIF